MAFSDIISLDILYMSNIGMGMASHNFGESVNCLERSFKPVFRQATVSFSIDDFIEQFNPPFPNYIKIDVDGIEDKIIDGAKKTLADKRFKSLLFEFNSKNKKKEKVFEILKNAGLIFYSAKTLVHSKTSKYRFLKNYIFQK